MSDQNINGYQNEQTSLNDNDYFDIDAYLGIDGYESRKVKWATIKNSILNQTSNIYNSNGTLTGNRLLIGNDNNLIFNELGGFQVLDNLGSAFTLTTGRVSVNSEGESASNQKGLHYIEDYTLDWDSNTFDKVVPTKGYVDRAVQGQGNARAEFYHYSLQTSQDHQPFFDDGIIQIGWDSPGNDVEVTMLTEPSGTGDMVSYAKTGSSSVVSTYITQPNLTYDVFPAGLTALEALVVLISAEQDPTFPSYRMTFHNAGTSYNTVVEIKKITPN